MRLLLAASPRAVRPDGREQPLAPRDAALLAWLALEGPTARNRVGALLWPDSAPEAARNALRQRLFNLRKQLGEQVVLGQATLQLAPGVVHDLHDADELLQGVALEAAGELAQWLDVQRSRRRGRVRRSLAERADMAEAARDWPDALAHARELLALEPLSEDAHRRVMRLQYLAGDRAAALLAFDACERVLKDEIGARPSPETLALLRTIEQDALADSSGTGLQRVPASVLRPPRLVGRDAEWATLLRQWPQHGLTLVAGEAGMGKSRLLGDLAQREGKAAVLARARPGDDAVPFALLARLMRGLLPHATCDVLPEPARRELARLLPELGDPPAAAAAGPLALQQSCELLLAQAAAQGVAGLLADDLHFADAASLELLQSLLTATPALAWVLAWRPGELTPGGRALAQAAARASRTQELPLAPLALADVAALIDTLAVPGLVGADLAPALLRHTGGNPLYLLETVKAMLLAPQADAAKTLPTARNVAQLIRQRLAGLSPQALKLARCAAVAGQDFSPVLATQVLGAGPLDLADAWAELEAAQVLRDAAFAHDLIHEATLASVPPVLARRLHALIAPVLAQQGAGAQRVAAHWLASDTPHDAVPSLLAAGRQAALALRPQEANAAYLRAADLLQSQGREAQARDALVDLLEMQYAPASEEIMALLARLDALARNPQQRAQAAHRRADVLARSGDFAAAGQVALKALDELDAAAHPALAAQLLCAAAAGDVMQGRHDRALERVHRANDLAARSGDLQAETVAAGYLGSVLDHGHRYAEAYLAHRRCHELNRRNGSSPIEQISTLSNLAGNRALLGQFDAALDFVQQAWRLAGDARLDLASQWPALRFQHALALLGLGEYTQALRMVDDAIGDLERYMPAWLPAAHNLAAAIWMQLGQWARARQAVQAALRDGPATLPRYRLRALALVGEIAAALHEPPAALAAPEELRSLAQLAGPAGQHLQGLTDALAGPPDHGYVLALRMRGDAAARQMPNLVLEAEARCAALALRAGEPGRAAEHGREALARLREALPNHLYRGEVWLAAVQSLLPVAPDEARRALSEALQWVKDTAQQRVPVEFRDSFLHRNPANRELLALAARHGATHPSLAPPA
jgi:DNA-binding SARP family transcriptional activator